LDLCIRYDCGFPEEREGYGPSLADELKNKGSIAWPNIHFD
jgi:hypothetical protein